MILPFLAKCKINGVNVRITISFEVKIVNIDIKEYNTKEKLLEKIKQEHIELESDTPIENLGFGNLVDYLYIKT